MNAVVTGSRTGIGRAAVEKLAEKGINIWAFAHRRDDAYEEDIKNTAKKYPG